MPFIVNKIVRIKSDIIKIRIVKKYLLISWKSKFIFVNINLFVNTFFGLLKDKIWFKEYFNKEYIFINLKPELVEKKEPPIITKIKNKRDKFFWSSSRENPILDMLLVIDKKLIEKSTFKLKKRKKIAVIIIR